MHCSAHALARGGRGGGSVLPRGAAAGQAQDRQNTAAAASFIGEDKT